MAIKHADEYRDPAAARALIDEIRKTSRTPIRIMEVCGTHTVALFRSGVRDMLPATISLLSGPGCPVCVTAQGEIDAFIDLARIPEVTIATFGDLIRVPGSDSSLQQERASGRDIRMVYSTMDALTLARENPERQVVFLGVGFETTAPTIAAAVLAAQAEGLRNFSVYGAHKLVPPALDALVKTEGIAVDGFLLPGHVSVIIGVDAYRPLAEASRIPMVVGGFEPTDLLQAILMLVHQIENSAPALENAYPRAVSNEGNPRARQVMDSVFTVADTVWRGIGVIAGSGLAFREAFTSFDAARKFSVALRDVPEPPGCACGEILTGLKIPPQCALYKKRCTPTRPVGPCMVSSEGTCAAYYRYHQS
ncbi:MAG: hydrogenase formation protein HypD [Pseudomonadota bacterium]